MAIPGVGSYANAYENLYVSKRNESNVSKQTKASGTDGISTAKTETAKKSSNEEYLKSLQKQVPYIKLQTGYGLNANNEGKINVVDVNPNPSKPIYIQTVWGVGYRFNKNLIA